MKNRSVSNLNTTLIYNSTNYLNWLRRNAGKNESFADSTSSRIKRNKNSCDNHTRTLYPVAITESEAIEGLPKVISTQLTRRVLKTVVDRG